MKLPTRIPISTAALVVVSAITYPIAGQASSGIDTQYVDAKVAPGSDFYRHINGGWLEQTQIPADRSNYGAFSELDDRAREQLRVILEEAANSDSAPGSRQQKLGALYSAFMDTDAIKARGTRPLDRDLLFIDARYAVMLTCRWLWEA